MCISYTKSYNSTSQAQIGQIGADWVIHETPKLRDNNVGI